LFYIGKGQGRRIEDHLKDAMKDNINSDKINRLQTLLKDNDFQSIAKVIGRYATASEAYAVESTLIKWVYGFENLTNEVHGHKHNNIRPKDCYDTLDNLDVPEKVVINTGDFTRLHKELNELHDIEPKLLSLMKMLESNIPKNLKYRVDMSRPKDPSLYIQGHDYIIQLILRNSSNDNVVLNVKPVSEKYEHFEQLSKKLGANISGSEKNKYFKVPGIPKKVSIHNEHEVLRLVELLVNL
jgi:hypothetical protein